MTAARYRAGKRLWSAADDRRLRQMYPDRPTAEVAVRMGRTTKAVYARAKTLKLAKSAAYKNSPASGRFGFGLHPNSAKHWFQPGQAPANKGLKRPGWVRGRMAETQFRKGSQPHTWVPVGTEVVDRDGYRKRKVSDDRSRPSRFNWKFVHVLVWEAAHGPVPAGHAIAFKDGDNAHLALGNLECISRRSLMARNTVHTLPQPLAQAIQLLGALNRRLRRSPRGEKQDRRSA